DGTLGHPGGHRRGRRVPRRPAGALDQRAGHPRQRSGDLMPQDNESKVIVVTGASSGFGAMSVRATGRSGHTVYAGMRGTTDHNVSAVADLDADAKSAGVDLRATEMDVSDQDSVDKSINQIIAECGRVDVIVHNAGHMVLGPAEAFTPEQLASVYDTNVLGAQRVNRAALPHLRAQQSGLVVWVGSSSTRGGCPPFLGPYFAAKAAGDALAVSYAGELIRFGIETTIVVPGAFTSGTNHFANAGTPEDSERADAYTEQYGKLRDELPDRLGSLVPPTQRPARSRPRSLASSICPTGSDRFASTSTPVATAAKSSPRSLTASASSSTTASGSRTSSRRTAASNQTSNSQGVSSCRLPT